MKFLKLNIIIIYFFLMISSFAIGKMQQDSSVVVNKSNIISIDSLGNSSTSLIEDKKDEAKYVMSKSPTKAVLFSLLLPGMGQLYVKSYWKVPLFVGATGTLVYLIVDNNNKFNQFEAEWKALEDNDANKSRLKLKKEFYRDQRDMDAFYLLGVYVISAIDAYVGAHLYDFNVNDNLSFKFSPNIDRGVLFLMTIEF